MFKKISLLTVITATSIATVAAHAAASGFYVQGEILDALHQKTTLSAPAAVTGPFLNTSYLTTNLGETTATQNKSSLGGKIALGYQINPYVGFELGFADLSGNSLQKTLNNEQITSLYNQETLISSIYKTYNIHLNQKFIDLLVKPIYPVTDRFSVYGKAGVAYDMTRLSGSATTVSNGTDKYGQKSFPVSSVTTSEDLSKNQNKFVPEVGVGVSYDVTPNVPVGLEYTFLKTSQTINGVQLGNTNMVGATVGYRFG